MNELAGGWGVGATWTDSNGKDHPINSGNDLEYKIPTGKSLYVFNYRTAGYRSRRLVALTDKIHHDTLTGKGNYYWNNQKKNGKMSFFVCDIKGEETAKKIVTKYCNDNNCFAYLLLDTNDYTKSIEGFDKLVEDVGSENLLKVSDYKHLTQYTGPRKSVTRNANGAVSDQDVFYIHGYTKDNKNITNPYNDAKNLRVLSEDQLDDFLEQDEIVYIPMLRYKTEANSGCPEIRNIVALFNDSELQSIMKTLIGDTKIYAIKTAFVKKLENDGYKLVSFNDFFKRQLQKVSEKHFKNLSVVNNMTAVCRQDFTSEEQVGRGYGYTSTTDKQFMFHMLNIFGLNYDKFINNQILLDCLNKTMITEFFANTVHEHNYKIVRFSQEEYFAHMTKLMKGMGIDNIDTQEIRDANVGYNKLIRLIEELLYPYPSAESYLKIIRSSSKTNLKNWKMSEIREKIKTEVDKNPMLKYIMGTNQVNGNLTELNSKNNDILKESSYYYGKKNKDWIEQMSEDNVDLFRIQLSSLIK
jgi:hypothetical protein